jgi:glycosyltransferase involved in cell wall biosynthesis
MRKTEKQAIFIARLFYPHVGGVEKHLEKLSVELSRRGYKITIITSKHESQLQNYEIYKNIEILRINYPKIKLIGLLTIWFKLIHLIKLFKTADIIHIHDVFIWYLPIKLLLPKKKIFTTFHGQWGHYPLSLNDVLQKRVAAYLSTANLSIGEYIPKNYDIKANILSYGAVERKNINSLTKKDNMILYVGRLDSELPIRQIFKVLEKLSAYKKVICGDGSLRNEARKYGEVKGFVDPTPFYKKAKFVFASGYLTIIEALSNKCLVFVVYENDLHKDYYTLTPFKNYIVIASSSADLFKKLKYYEKNPKISQKLIGAGYNWAIMQTWTKMANMYEKLWKT